MNCADIQTALDRHFSDAWMRIRNSYILGWEADYLCWVDKAYWCEVEIKVTKSDFKRDFTHKPDKHSCLQKALQGKAGVVLKPGGVYTDYNSKPGDSWHNWIEAKACRLYHQNIPNRFYFACPENLIEPGEVPKGYGLIYVLENGTTRLVKRPQTIHKERLDVMEAVATKQHFVIEDLKKQIANYEHENRKLLQRTARLPA